MFPAEEHVHYCHILAIFHLTPGNTSMLKSGTVGSGGGGGLPRPITFLLRFVHHKPYDRKKETN
jgi:hypothetical protein